MQQAWKSTLNTYNLYDNDYRLFSRPIRNYYLLDGQCHRCFQRMRTLHRPAHPANIAHLLPQALFDQPDERKIHQGAVPRLGGIAFKPVVFFSIALMFGLCQFFGYGNMFDGISAESRPLAFSFCCVMLLYLVGMADDLIGIRYKAKFAVQIMCGVMMIAGGMWISNLHGLFGIHEVAAWFGYPLTILVIVFIINSINLIDGIDGLASGLCGVATLFYGMVFFLLQEYIYAVLSFATLGVLVPFFYYNVFGDANKQKKIFMGDTGSLTTGMVLCVLSLKSSNTRRRVSRTDSLIY